MKVLYGNIVVQVTNLTSMGFLSGLKAVECEGYGSNDQIEVDSNPAMIEVGMTSLENTSCNIEVSRNSNLKTLGLPNLKNFYNLNPEASELNKISLNAAEHTTCVTIQEATHFLSSDCFDYEMNGVDFCQLSSYSILIADEKVCKINNFTLSTFDSSCKRIAGNVLIKAGDEEYVEKMKDVTWIYGSLWIYDTQLSAVDFFDNLQYIANVKDPTKAVVIQSNPNLVTAVFPKLKRVRTDIEFRNNNQEFNLDISLCFETKQGINATVWRRTVVDGVHCKTPCIFQPYHINSETLKSFPTNCTSACAYLLIDQSSDVTESQLTEAFKNMKTLYGTLDILKTNFKNVKFLAGLETVECETDDRLKIDDNDQMTEIGMTNLTSTSCEIAFRGISGSFEKLNLPKLKNFYSLNASLPKQINMRIDGLSNFCLTVEEVTNFLSNDFLKLQIGGSIYCKTNITEVSGEELCQIQNFTIANFDTSCKRVLGNIIIRPGDEEYVNNLKSVTWVYGRILVFGTSLKSIDFFDSLKYVAEVDTAEFSIHIRDNEQLESVVFPKLKKVIQIIRLEGNHKNLFPDPSICFEVNDGLNLTVFRKSTIDDSNCQKMYQNIQKDGTSYKYLGMQAVLILLLLTLE